MAFSTKYVDNTSTQINWVKFDNEYWFYTPTECRVYCQIGSHWSGRLFLVWPLLLIDGFSFLTNLRTLIFNIHRIKHIFKQLIYIICLQLKYEIKKTTKEANTLFFIQIGSFNIIPEGGIAFFVDIRNNLREGVKWSLWPHTLSKLR